VGRPHAASAVMAAQGPGMGTTCTSNDVAQHEHKQAAAGEHTRAMVCSDAMQDGWLRRGQEWAPPACRQQQMQSTAPPAAGKHTGVMATIQYMQTQRCSVQVADNQRSDGCAGAGNGHHLHAGR
jgi:hypothetical protein